MESKKTRESSLTDFNIKEMIESTRRRSLVFSLLVVSVDCEQSDKRQLPFLHQYKLVSQRQITELQFLDQPWKLFWFVHASWKNSGCVFQVNLSTKVNCSYNILYNNYSVLFDFNSTFSKLLNYSSYCFDCHFFGFCTSTYHFSCSENQCCSSWYL